MKGYVQVYTGNGKGKSTAAFGLALRARGAGLSVNVIQFIKSMEYSEIKMLESIGINIDQFGRGCFIKNDAEPEDRQAALDALDLAGRIINENTADLLILDEINVAHYFKIVTDNEIKNILENRPADMEIVLTGRYAPDFLIEKADLVTEMKEIKHYYSKGIEARTGIEL